jgi:hypothetical protein
MVAAWRRSHKACRAALETTEFQTQGYAGFAFLVDVDAAVPGRTVLSIKSAKLIG